jgi:hypothetical protein
MKNLQARMRSFAEVIKIRIVSSFLCVEVWQRSATGNTILKYVLNAVPIDGSNECDAQPNTKQLGSEERRMV